MGLSGHCLCGAVKYTVDAEPLIVGYDHCDDCQRQSGSTYSLVVVVPKDKLKIEGTTKSFAGKGSSGQAVHRVFCPECGSPIAHDPEAAPPIIALKGGTLSVEDKKKLKPVSCYSSSFTSLLPAAMANTCNYLGHRDLVRLQAAFLPGAPGEALPAHARVNQNQQFLV